MVSLRSVVAASQNLSASELGDEVVLLDFGSSAYFGLDPVGAHIWRAIQAPTRVEAVCDAVLERFEVERDQCERDVVAFLDELVAEGLAEVRDDAGA